MSSDGIVDANPKTLLAHHAHLHTVRPVWYRDLPSLREMPHLAGLAWPSAETPRAYVVYQTGAADHADLFDLAATQPHDAIVLLRALQTKFSRITSGNEPADSPYLPAFEATGFRVTLERYGMIKDLT